MNPTERQPRIVVIAGPNGAGKSTFAPKLLSPGMVFLNADEMAKSIYAEPGQTVELQASRLLLRRLDECEQVGADVAVETTLASRTLASRIRRMQQSGYEFNLIYVWLGNVDLAVARVEQRVRRGGHSIPEETIRRRYREGLHNFFHLYRELADRWFVYENGETGIAVRVAEGSHGVTFEVVAADLWRRMRESAGDD